jgi:hypothetical protein
MFGGSEGGVGLPFPPSVMASHGISVLQIGYFGASTDR